MWFNNNLLILSASLLAGLLIIPSAFAGVWSCWPTGVKDSHLICVGIYAEEGENHKTEYNKQLQCVNNVIRKKTDTATLVKVTTEKLPSINRNGFIFIDNSNPLFKALNRNHFIMSVTIQDTVSPFPIYTWWTFHLNATCILGK